MLAVMIVSSKLIDSVSVPSVKLISDDVSVVA